MNRPCGSDNEFDERFRGDDFDDPRSSNNQQPRDSYTHRENRNCGPADNRNWNSNNFNEYGRTRNDSYRRNEFEVNSFDRPGPQSNQKQDFDERQHGRQDDYRGDHFSTRGSQYTECRSHHSDDQGSQRNYGSPRDYYNDGFDNENQGRFREEDNSYRQDNFINSIRGENRRNEQRFDDRRRPADEYPMERPPPDDWNRSYTGSNSGRNRYDDTDDDRYYSGATDVDRSTRDEGRQGSQNYRQDQGTSYNRGVGRSQRVYDREEWSPINESIETLADLERRRASNICTDLDYDVLTYSDNGIMKQKPAKKFGDIANAHTVETVLKDLGYRELRPIQKVASPYVQAGNDVFLRSSSGSGKTAAYLMPLVDRIILEKKKVSKELNSPFVLIVCPSLELAKHLYEVARVFCADTSVQCGMLIGHMGQNPPVANRNGDILVGTATRLAGMLDNHLLTLNSTFSIVVEEADWYWEQSSGALEVIFNRHANSHVQRICVTGTYPKAFNLPHYFRKECGVICYTKQPLPAAIHRFERVNQFSFAKKLIQEIKNEKGGVYRCIVVCHNQTVRQRVFQLLTDENIEAKDYSILFKNDGNPAERDAILNQLSEDKLRVVITGDNALLRGIRIPRIQKVIHLDSPMVTERHPSLLCTLHHRLGPVAFSTEGESVFLLNVDEKHNIDMVKALADVVEVVPDWMYRVASQGCWIVDDKTAADVAANKPEEEKAETIEEEEQPKRNYNNQYQRQGWNNNRYRPRYPYNNYNGHYNNYNSGHYNNGQYNNGYYNNRQYNNGHYNSGQYTQGHHSGYCSNQNNVSYTPEQFFQAFEGMTMTPQVQQQVQKMYAQPVAAPFVAPDKQLIFEGNEEDFSSPILFDPKTLQTIRNDDGYIQVFQIKTASAVSAPKPESVTTDTEIKPADPPQKEEERTSMAHSPADSCGSSFIRVATPKSGEESNSISEQSTDTEAVPEKENSEEHQRVSEETHRHDDSDLKQSSVDDAPSDL